MENIRNIVGPVPEPDELFGRDELIENLWRQVEGNNVLLLAPRRFGKTGLMRHALIRPQEGFLPLYLYVEDVDSPEEFVWRITRVLLSHDRWRSVLATTKGVPRKIQKWIQDTFDEVGFSEAKVSFKDSVSENWQDLTRRLLATLETGPDRALILLDELPTMIENLIRTQGKKDAHDFLSWFRRVRLTPEDALRRHRFIIGGSIGIDVVLRRLDASDKFNDFVRLPVEPVSRRAAERLIDGLARTIDTPLSAELCDAFLDLIGAPVPYFIHLFVSQLAQQPVAFRQSLTPDALREVYHSRVQGPACKRYFDHYRDHLRRFGKLGEQAAMAILSEVAGSLNGRVSESALFALYRKTRKRGWSEGEFTELINDLECDWYLVRDPNTNEYYFMVKVIADWWKRWFTRRIDSSAG